MDVTLTRAGKTKLTVKVESAAGEIVLHKQVNPLAPAVQRDLCSTLRLPLQTLLSHFSQVNGKPYTFTAPDPPLAPGAATGPFTVWVRGLRQTLAAAVGVTRPTAAEAVVAALSDVPAGLTAEPVCQWDGTDALAVLDIDLHQWPAAERYTADDVDSLAARGAPRPVCWHRSHGGGAKMYYAGRDGFAAGELAAVAALSWQGLDGRATYEIKRETRHPGAPRNGQTAGPLRIGAGDADLEAVRRWLGRESDDTARDEWLADRGWGRGEHREHSDCLIAPGHATHGKPVLAGDLGIFCHNCEQHGRCYPGKTRPGWVPYAALTGGPAGRISLLLRKCVHWHHARHTLRHLFPHTAEPVLRTAYRAGLKLLHGTDDPRVDGAMDPKLAVIRMSGQWYFDAGRRVATKVAVERLIPLLPAVAGKADEAAFMNGGVDLSSHGYADLYPVYGCRVWGQYLPYPNDPIPLTVPAASLPPEFQPRYAPAGKRLSVEAAWATVERDFPGISRRYVELLICAAAMAEGGREGPMVFTTGVSGAGKTTTAAVVAAIRGTGFSEIVWSEDTTRLRMSVAKAAAESGLVCGSEWLKDARRAKQSETQALDPILNFTPGSTSHELHVGPVKLGRYFAAVVTDISIPPAVRADLQIARRLWHVHLDRAAGDWRASLEANGAGPLDGWRAASRERADAANAILSDLTDRYFRSPPLWADIAADLGAVRLSESTDMGDPHDALRRLFAAVAAAPPLTGSHATRYPGAGWKLVSRDAQEGDELSEAWADVADDANANWHTSRRVDSEDWRRVLAPLIALPFCLPSVTLDVRRYKASFLYVRFRAGGNATAPGRINGDILKPE